MAGRKTMIAVTIANVAYIGFRKVLGGVIPRIRSRITPPPTAVVRPRITTPRISIFFLRPVIAPETENATVPISSRTSTISADI